MGEFDPDAFFQLHADLPREGPGEAADIAWAAELADLKPDALVLDAGSGPGGDVGTLLRAAPQGHVTAVDLHGPFIDAAQARWGKDDRVTLMTGHMLAPKGPFDFIWCAGAVYFLGIGTVLSAWRPCLASGGSIAFSEPCYFTENPSAPAPCGKGRGSPPLKPGSPIRSKQRATGFWAAPRQHCLGKLLLPSRSADCPASRRRSSARQGIGRKRSRNRWARP